MIREMQMNASNDKEFVQNELRKKILSLEKQIEDLRKEQGDDHERGQPCPHDSIFAVEHSLKHGR